MIFAPAQSGLGVIWIEIGQCIKPDSPRAFHTAALALIDAGTV